MVVSFRIWERGRRYPDVSLFCDAKDGFWRLSTGIADCVMVDSTG